MYASQWDVQKARLSPKIHNSVFAGDNMESLMQGARNEEVNWVVSRPLRGISDLLEVLSDQISCMGSSVGVFSERCMNALPTWMPL